MLPAYHAKTRAILKAPFRYPPAPGPPVKGIVAVTDS